MVRSMRYRQIGILLSTAILAVAATVGYGSVTRVFADPILHGSCETAHKMSFPVQSNPGPNVTVGLTVRPCSDGINVWNYSSTDPSACYASYSRAVEVDGVCGYAGALTTHFSYIVKITIKNTLGVTLITLGLDLAGADLTFGLPQGWERTCTITYPITPYDVAHNSTESGYLSCGPSKLI